MFSHNFSSSLTFIEFSVLESDERRCSKRFLNKQQPSNTEIEIGVSLKKKKICLNTHTDCVFVQTFCKEHRIFNCWKREGVNLLLKDPCLLAKKEKKTYKKAK